MQFWLTYLLFGPLVAIPLGLGTTTLVDMVVQGMIAQLTTLTVIHFALIGLDYPALQRRALLEKFAEVAKRKVGDVQHNTEKIETRFYNEFGHFGYYLSLIFFSFTVGVAWSTVIAFALRLNTAVSAVFILIGSLFGFGFWYFAIQYSLNYVAKDVFFVVAVVISVLLLFYGQLRERHILTRIKRAVFRS